MKERLEQWRDRFDSLNLRERILMMLVAMVLVYVGVDSLLMANTHKNRESLRLEITDWKKRNAEVDQRIKIMTSQLQAGVDGNQSQEVKQLNSQLNAASKRLEEIVVKFIHPQEMIHVLKSLLEKEKGLRLIKLESQEPVGLFTDDAEGSSISEVKETQKQVRKLLQFYSDRSRRGIQADYDKARQDLAKEFKKEELQQLAIPQVYKHGVLLELMGSYSATLSYLKNLEGLPWKFYWDAVRYEVVKYPKAKISILINTLSLEEEWVRV